MSPENGGSSNAGLYQLLDVCKRLEGAFYTLPFESWWSRFGTEYGKAIRETDTIGAQRVRLLFAIS
jgi:hypothetical protein